MKKYFFLKFSAVIIALFSITSCKKDITPESANMQPTIYEASAFPVDEMYYLLKAGTRLDMVSKDKPGQVLTSVPITNLQSGETILSIDFRPATGQLYGLGSNSRLYVINTETGSARMIGSGPFAPALTGTVAGFDFNPTVDRIRVVTNSGQNLRLNPETGMVAAVDGNINGPGQPSISAVAYTENMAGASTTTLYDIDYTSNKLFRQNPPNNGTLEEVGSLGMTVSANGGFDIGANELALGLFTVANKSVLLSINLTTGAAKNLFTYDNAMYTGIAIPTNPVAYAVADMNQFLIFNPLKTKVVVSKTITGLQSGDALVGIDMRPVNGQIFALGKNSNLYTINASSGAATFVAALSTPLNGTNFGFDFNPLVDRIRIVSNTGQNLRVIPTTGAATVDGTLNPGSPSITAAAYTDNFAGTTTTTLYVIDNNDGMLYRQDPPNAGTLKPIGSLGKNLVAENGFDISGRTNTALAILSIGGSKKIYSIDITSGAARKVGDFDTRVNGFTLGLGF